MTDTPEDITPLDFKLIFYEHLEKDGIYSFDAELIELDKESDVADVKITDVKIRTLTDPKKIFDWKLGKIYMLPVKKHTKLPGVYMLLLKWKELVHTYLDEEEANPMKQEPLPDFDYIPPNTDVPSVSDDKPSNWVSENETVRTTGSQSLTETTNLEEVYEGEIIKSPSSLLAYLPPIEEAKAYFKYLQDFKLSVLDKTDVILIKGNLHIKRSGWEKFVNVFRLDHRIISTKKEITKQHLVTYKKIRKLGNNIKVIDKDEWLDGIQYTVIVEMKSLTGSTTQGIGLVQQYEGGREDRKEHDILTHAETRAFNRACSKIVGLGEVSAEEMN